MQNCILKALEDYGTTTIAGPRANQKIINYFAEAGFPNIGDDEIAWCAAFVGYILDQCNLPKSNSLMARSYLHLGVEVETPQMGDLVIFWRINKQGPYGHVGFYVSETEKNVYVLGGNQNCKVEISAFDKQRVLGYRRLVIEA